MNGAVCGWIWQDGVLGPDVMEGRDRSVNHIRDRPAASVNLRELASFHSSISGSCRCGPAWLESPVVVAKQLHQTERKLERAYVLPRPANGFSTLREEARSGQESGSPT